MSTAAVSNPLLTQAQQFFQTRRADLQQLGKALENGNLAGAQTAYNNIVKLWRDFGAVPTLFTDDLLRARSADAAIVGSPKSVREKIAAYFEETGANYLVLSFAWGGLNYEQSRHSLDLFVSEVLPHFASSGKKLSRSSGS